MTWIMRPSIGRLGCQSCQRGRSLLSPRLSRPSAAIQLHTRLLPSGTVSTPRTFSSQQSSSRPDFPKPLQARSLPSILLLGVVLAGGAGYYFTVAPSRPDTLNQRFFVPYTVTAREAISPSSFVITVVPHTPNPAHPYLHPVDPSSSSSPAAAAAPARWRHPLWSVEFKQPEVQIARHYTPLPPLEGEDPADGALRFYIRTVGDGEMSHYLARRRVGQDVHLRGPHAGFELAERLGGRSRVVFLAGGTGVVPGMQAAKAVLDANSDTTVHILWAVRKREEIQASAAPVASSPSSWRFWQEKQPVELGNDIQNPSPVSRHLNHLKAAYGDRLKVQVAIDAEGTRFKDRHIKNALTAGPKSSPPTTLPSAAGCRFHDQTMHIGATEFAALEGPGCICPSDMGKPGKNLFVISGPDGFIQHYAGQKIWYGGNQTQGPIGGVTRQLQHQEPQLAQDWIVLKM